MQTQYLWIALAGAVPHVFEEVWTGFLGWFRTLMPKYTSAINIPWYTIVNSLMVAYGLWAVNWESGPLFFRLSFPVLLILNALVHIIAALRTRKYNPGLITSIVLYLPIGTLCIQNAMTTEATTSTLCFAFLLAAVVYTFVPLSLFVSSRIIRKVSPLKEVN